MMLCFVVENFFGNRDMIYDGMVVMHFLCWNILSHSPTRMLGSTRR